MILIIPEFKSKPDINDKTEKKREMTIKIYGEVGYGHMGFSPPCHGQKDYEGHSNPQPPFPHTHGKPSNQHMRNFIKLDSRMYMSAEWNVAETIVSEVVL